MPDKNWKAVERRVAKKLGGQRIPLSGRNNMDKIGDVELEGFTVEVKSGAQIPKTVSNWLDELRGLTKDERVPILVMQPKWKKEQVVVLTLSDFSDLIGSVEWSY